MPKQCSDCFTLLPDSITGAYEGTPKRKIEELEVNYCPRCGEKVTDW